jgi:hypothetical protein
VILNHFLKAIAMPAKCLSLQVYCGRRHFGRNKLSWLLLPTLLSTPSIALDTQQGARKNSGQIAKDTEFPIADIGVLYNSGNRPDPFLNPLLLKQNSKSREDEEVARGLPPPGIAGTYIAQASLQGIAVSDDGRIAVVRGADTRAYFLKEGDRLFDGYVKAIENDFITLVRETKLRSGKVLTQDVIKRLRTP